MIPDYDTMLNEAFEELSKIKVKKESTEGRLNIPTPIVIQEKKRTVLQNAKQISDVLNRDIKILMKFFQTEFHVPSRIEGNSIIISKNFSFEDIKKRLDKFIETFVRCPVCKSLDTRLEKRDKVYIIKCLACGAESSVLYKLS